MQTSLTRCGLWLIAGLLFSGAALGASAQDGHDEDFGFDDATLSEPYPHPSWFKENLHDLQGDVKDAKAKGKRVAAYFGQKHCPYCRALMEKDFGKADITEYTRRHFDVVPINIWSNEEMWDPKGNVITEREYAVREKANFTPSLLFYDEQGNSVFALRGFYPPYKFRAALEYVADRHYERETFKEYLERADPTMSFEPGGLNEADFFEPPPYALDRSRFAANKPLIVFFEQGNCHACDVLHTEQLQDVDILKELENFESVQLDTHADTKIITPQGERTTAKKWAHELNVFYTPTLIFYDESGKEIIRVDSVVRFFRLLYVLQYVGTKAYEDEPNFQYWRATNRPANPAQ